jgi:hypothetical protein
VTCVSDFDIPEIQIPDQRSATPIEASEAESPSPSHQDAMEAGSDKTQIRASWRALFDKLANPGPQIPETLAEVGGPRFGQKRILTRNRFKKTPKCDKC